MDEFETKQRVMTLGGLRLCLLPAAPYCARYTPDMPVAGFAFESQNGVHAFASDRVRPFHAAANGLAFTPAGCSVYSEACNGGEYLTLSGTPTALGALLDEDGAELPPARFTGRMHPQGVRAAHGLRRLLLGRDADPAAVESAAAAFLRSLCECGVAAWRPPPSAGSLTLRRLKRVEELIEARLAERISVSDMAGACGLSTGFFLRAFKAATGRTPHRFLMDRRIARARRLLMDERLGAGEVAYRAGFSSQAHMATAFKRALGVSPSICRRAGGAASLTASV